MFKNRHYKRLHKRCFVSVHCSLDCPNFQIDMLDDRYGYGISDDIGLERISCKDCYYNSGKCDDCIFVNTQECSLIKS